MSDMPEQNDLSTAQLRTIFAAADDHMVFILNQAGHVVLHNDAAQLEMPTVAEAQSWLRGTFHDAVNRAPVMTSPLPKMLTDTKPLTLGWLREGGGEGRATFTCLALPGTDLFVLRVRALDQKAETLAPMMQNLGPTVHELGNILGIIQMAAEGLNRFELPIEAAAKVEDLLTAAQRGNALLQTMSDPALLLAKPPAEPTHVSPTLTRAADVFRRVLPETVAFSISLDKQAHVTDTSSAELEAIGIELLSAARKFLALAHPIKGTISITAQICDSSCKISVEAKAPLTDFEYAPDFTDIIEGDRTQLVAARVISDRINGGLRIERAGASEIRLSLALPTSPCSSQQIDHHGTDSLAGYRICVAQSDKGFEQSLTNRLREYAADVMPFGPELDLDYVMAQVPRIDVLITNASTAHAVGLDAQLARQTSPIPRTIVLTGQAPSTKDHNLRKIAVFLTKPVDTATLINAIKLAPPQV